jgi:hypothetical protein
MRWEKVKNHQRSRLWFSPKKGCLMLKPYKLKVSKVLKFEVDSDLKCEV